MSPIVLLAAWLLPAVLTAQGGPTPEAHLQSGKRLLEDGKLLPALDHFLEVLKDKPEHVEAKTYLTRVTLLLLKDEKKSLLTSEELKEAVDTATRVLEGERKRVARLKADLEGVGRRLEDRNATGSGLLDASVTLSRLNQQDIEDAVTRQQMAVYVRALQERLRAELLKGTFTGAKDQLAARGFIWFYRGQHSKALELLKRALALSPGDDALREQARWLERRVRAAEKKTAVDSLLASAERLGASGRYAEAMAQLRSASLMNVDEVTQKRIQELEDRLTRGELDRRVARAKRLGGSTLGAAQAWLAVLELDPLHAEARETLKTIQQGLTVASKLPPARPNSSASVAELPSARGGDEARRHYALGLIFYAQGDLVRARREMESALKLNPDFKEAKVSLERIRSEIDIP